MSDGKTPAHPISRKRQRLVEDCSHRRTRPKFDAPPPFSASNRSASAQPALIPTSVRNSSADTSDFEADSPSSSEVSESSEDPSSENSSEDSDGESGSHVDTDDENAVVNLRANRGKKPKIKLGADAPGPDIKSFLKDFLPQLKAANEQLEIERKAGTLKNKEIDRRDDIEGEVEEQYIEMDLGLGVLEQCDPNVNSCSESDSGSDNEHVLAKLMGQEIGRDTGIQELSSIQDT